MKRLLPWIVSLCSLAMFASLAIPLLTGRIFVFNDLTWFHLPMRLVYQQALRAGDSLLWTPSILSGFHLHGEGQVGLLHPLHLVLYRLFPLSAAFNLELLANYAGAFAGTYWLLRRLRVERGASLLGAMLFAFGGFNLLHHHHLNAVAVVAHMPWLLGCVDVLLTDGSRRRCAAAFAGVALIFTSEHLLGFPPGVWWNLIAVGGFVWFRAAHTSWRRVLAAALALAVGGLMGAVQLLPMLEASARSVRPAHSRDFALSWSLHPINILQFWSPYGFTGRVFEPREFPWVHELGVYSGSLSMLVLPWLWIRRRALGARRTLIRGYLLFAAVGLVLALGRYGGLAVLLTYLPGFGSVRAPARYIVLTQFALTVLAAVAFADLASRRHDPLTRRETLILCAPLALNLLTIVVFNTGWLTVGRAYPFSPVTRAGKGTLLLALTTALFLLAARNLRVAIGGLVVVAMVDLATWGILPMYREPPRRIGSIAATAPPPPGAPEQSYAYADHPLLPGNVLVLAGYRTTSGYAGLHPRSAFDFRSRLAQQLGGARWEFSIGHWQTPMEGPVDRARLLAAAVVSDDPGRDASTIDHDDTVLLGRAVPALRGPPGTATVVVDRPGHIVVRTSAPGRQVLVLTEREHPGWTATAGGAPIEVVAAYGDFLGAVVEAGTHRVEFRFRPRSFVNGAMLSGIGLILLPLGCLIVARRLATPLDH